jgi:hypothetical protein
MNDKFIGIFIFLPLVTVFIFSIFVSLSKLSYWMEKFSTKVVDTQELRANKPIRDDSFEEEPRGLKATVQIAGLTKVCFKN